MFWKTLRRNARVTLINLAGHHVFQGLFIKLSFGNPTRFLNFKKLAVLMQTLQMDKFSRSCIFNQVECWVGYFSLSILVKIFKTDLSLLSYKAIKCNRTQCSCFQNGVPKKKKMSTKLDWHGCQLVFAYLFWKREVW